MKIERTKEETKKKIADLQARAQEAKETTEELMKNRPHLLEEVERLKALLGQN